MLDSYVASKHGCWPLSLAILKDKIAVLGILHAGRPSGYGGYPWYWPWASSALHWKSLVLAFTLGQVLVNYPANKHTVHTAIKLTGIHSSFLLSFTE